MKKDLLFIILIICLANTIIWGIEIKVLSGRRNGVECRVRSGF